MQVIRYQTEQKISKICTIKEELFFGTVMSMVEVRYEEPNPLAPDPYIFHLYCDYSLSWCQPLSFPFKRS